MSILQELRPTQKINVIDLLRKAGVDVSDWPNYKGAHAAANPRYCYEWAFREPEKLVVLNLWHSGLEPFRDTVRLRINMRKRANYFARIENRPLWAVRARRFDEACEYAFTRALPIRVIVCDGRIRDSANPQDGPSKVKRRYLDPKEWFVSKYSFINGDCVLTRGGQALKYVDQFSVGETANLPLQKRTVTTEKFIRSAAVRNRVLTRAKGNCELCGRRGFLMDDGSIYLETHHIVPLCEKGSDDESNVVALCPNHHREAHHAVGRSDIRAKLLTLYSSPKVN
jgi:hypothetical protein